LGVPVAAVELAEVELDADEAVDDVDDLELELPHALTAAVITNRQAAIAASLLKRMALLIPRLSSLVQPTRRRSLWPVCGWTFEAARGDGNTLVDDFEPCGGHPRDSAFIVKLRGI
jgi:hypothetical protein